MSTSSSTPAWPSCRRSWLRVTHAKGQGSSLPKCGGCWLTKRGRQCRADTRPRKARSAFVERYRCRDWPMVPGPAPISGPGEPASRSRWSPQQNCVPAKKNAIALQNVVDALAVAPSARSMLARESSSCQSSGGPLSACERGRRLRSRRTCRNAAWVSPKSAKKRMLSNGDGVNS
jgi:hypothetical protein